MDKKFSEIRALSVRQPWAHIITHEGKVIENRSWATKYRGTIAIHASGTWYEEDIDFCKKEYGIKVNPATLPYMAIVGFADIVDVVTKSTVKPRQKKWFMGEYGFVLDNIKPLSKPIEVKGALGFWRLNGKALQLCLQQLSHKQVTSFEEFKKAA